MGRQIDLKGQKFGHLTAIEYLGNSIWKCLCDCGNYTEVDAQYLKNGKTKSCGCVDGTGNKQNNKISKPKKDLTGMTFGYLTPLYYKKGGIWHCECSCGNEVDVTSRNLTTGHTKSCGCYLREKNSINNTKDMTGYETDDIKVIKRVGSTKLGIALWECICKHCGRTFTTEGANIRSGETQSCGCIHSLNEIKITQMLLDNNIDFQTQYTFDDLFGRDGKHPLRFDFAIFYDGKLSHLIEYNGIQHYEKPKGKWADTFDRLQENDQKKIQYCKEHNIELRIIKYNQDYTLEDLL